MEQFRGVLLEAIGDARPLEVAEPDIAPKEERQFSFIRAIRASATGDWREAGYEREVSDEIARQSGRTPKGIFAPVSAWGQRNLIAGADVDGGFLKPTDHYGNEFIAALHGRLVTAGLGARILSGLKGGYLNPEALCWGCCGFRWRRFGSCGGQPDLCRCYAGTKDAGCLHGHLPQVDGAI